MEKGIQCYFSISDWEKEILRELPLTSKLIDGGLYFLWRTDEGIPNANAFLPRNNGWRLKNVQVREILAFLDAYYSDSKNYQELEEKCLFEHLPTLKAEPEILNLKIMYDLLQVKRGKDVVLDVIDISKSWHPRIATINIPSSNTLFNFTEKNEDEIYGLVTYSRLIGNSEYLLNISIENDKVYFTGFDLEEIAKMALRRDVPVLIKTNSLVQPYDIINVRYDRPALK